MGSIRLGVQYPKRKRTAPLNLWLSDGPGEHGVCKQQDRKMSKKIQTQVATYTFIHAPRSLLPSWFGDSGSNLNFGWNKKASPQLQILSNTMSICSFFCFGNASLTRSEVGTFVPPRDQRLLLLYGVGYAHYPCIPVNWFCILMVLICLCLFELHTLCE